MELIYLDSWKLFEGFDRNSIDKFSKRNRGNLTVFHRTKDTHIESIGRDGYRSGGGDAWGPGIYTCYDLISTTKANVYNRGDEKSGVYGPVIIENKLASLKNFLIFDYDVAKKIYVDGYKLEDQLKKILPENVYQKFQQVILEASEICDYLYKKSPKNKYTTNAVQKIFILPEIRHYLRGMIFTGANDGKVLLSYDRENIIPINYSKDNGKTWKKFTKQGVHRIARENLRNLLKSNSKDLSTYLQDHINNQLTSSNFKSFDEYLEKTIRSKNFSELTLLNDFEYIFDLKEEEYPNIKSIKSQISNLYKDYIIRVIDVIKDCSEIDIGLLNSNLFVTLPKKIEKYFPNLIKDYNSSFEIYLGKIIEGVKKSEENKNISNSLVQLSNHLKHLDVENLKYGKDKIAELKSLTSEILKKVSDFAELNNQVINEIKKYCETYESVDNLEVESTSGFKAFFDLQREIANKLNVLSENTKVIKYLKSRSIDKYYVRPLDEMGNSTDYIRLNWSMVLLPNETIDKLEEIYNVKIVGIKGGPLNDFFNNVYIGSLENVDLKNLFDKKIKSLSKYFDNDFYKSLNNNYYEPELKFELFLNSKELDEESKSILLYSFFASKKWRPLLKRLKERNFIVDKNIQCFNSKVYGGEYLTKKIFNSEFDLEKLMEMKEIFTENLFLQILSIGHYTGYIKNLDENLLKTIKTKLQDESFCINLIDCVVKQYLDSPPGSKSDYSLSPAKIISMMPIKLSLIIKSGKLDEKDLNYFAQEKMKKVIEGGDIKKIEAFILFLIENGFKFEYLTKLDDVDFSKLKLDTLIKMLSSKFSGKTNILHILTDKKIKNDDLVKYCISNKIESEYLFQLTDNNELKKQMSQKVIDNLSKDSTFDNGLLASIVQSFSDENMVKILKYVESLSNSSDVEDNEKVGPIAFIILILSKDRDNTYQKMNTKIKNSIDELVTEITKQNIDSLWDKGIGFLSEYNKDFTLVNTCKAFHLLVNSIKDETVKSSVKSFIQKNLKVSEKIVLNFNNFHLQSIP